MGIMIKNFEDVKNQVKLGLEKYLELHNIKKSRSGMYSCFLPALHKGGKDTVPSIKIYRDSTSGLLTWYCYGCKSSGTTYDAAKHLDNLDIDNNFLESTLFLATKLGIPYEESDDTTEVSNYRLMQEIYKYIIEKTDHTLLMNGKYGRNYNEEQAKEVASLIPCAEIDAEYIEEKLKAKFGEDCLKHLNIASDKSGTLKLSSLFSKSRCVIPLVNDKNTAIAFTSRANQKDLENSKVPKYQHSTPFNRKNDLPLYFLHKSLRYIKETKRIYIVEGTYDAASMFIVGFKNVAALLGTSLSDEAIRFLVQIGVKEAIICLDSDNAGLVAREEIFKSLASSNILVYFSDLESMDPDEVVINNKIELFNKITDSIVYILNETKCFESDNKTFNRRYIECLEFIITYCKTKAIYNTYATIIAHFLGLHQNEVLQDLIRYLDNHEKNTPFIINIRNKLRGVDNLIPEDMLSVLEAVQRDLSSYVAKNRINSFVKTHELFNNFMKQDSTDMSALPHLFRTGFKYLDDVIRLESKSLAFISAPPSNLKSTLMRILTLVLLKNDPNTMGIYISLDDTREKAMVSFIASLISQPKNTIEDAIRDNRLYELIDVKTSNEISYLFGNRLSIIGKETAPSMSTIKLEVSKIREDHPDKHIFCVIDAMDDLSDLRIAFDNNITGLNAIENVLSELSEMSVVHDILTIAIKHIKHGDNKNNRPQLHQIKGTGKVEYIAKTILLAYMDMHYNQYTDMSWTDKKTGTRYPTMEVHVAKEKDTPANTRRYLEINPSTIQMSVPDSIQHDDYDIICSNLISKGKEKSSNRSYDDHLAGAF
jgi:DNA primase